MTIQYLIQHRVNTSLELGTLSPNYGVEIDLRANEDQIILHHDSFEPGEVFDDYLAHYRHRFMILNTKCEGMEQRIVKMMEDRKIENYFFLDLSIPFMVKTIKAGCRKIAVRFSEYEPIGFVEQFVNKVEWVWVDCFTRNVLDKEAYQFLSKHFKLCIVSPELQGHPVKMIQDFKIAFQQFHIDAVCTKYPQLWL